jgi:superkiller protein 3
VIERRYAIANSNLARVLLAVGKDSDAAETFELAYGLLSADDDSAETVVLRAMCQFGGGIATFHLGDLQGAMSLFESALEIASGNGLVRGQVTVLLSQTLWAIGTDDFREAAKSQLLDWYASTSCLQSDGPSLTDTQYRC